MGKKKTKTTQVTCNVQLEVEAISDTVTLTYTTLEVVINYKSHIS